MDNWRELLDQTVMSSEEKELVKEVLRIKVFLDENVGGDVECGSSVAYESLRKLQHMVLSVKVLKETMIGESVAVFLKHASKDVSRVSRFLIDEWRYVVDKWVESNEKKAGLDQQEVKKDVTMITEPQRRRVLRIKVKTKSDWGKDNVVPKGPMITDPETKDGNDNGIDEVLRIKGVIEKSIGDEESVSQSTLLDSLKKLQHMDISIETLDKTGIGKTVSILKKHVSKDVRQIAITVVKAWIDMFEEWIKKDKSNVKPISEQVKNRKGNLVTHDQHCQSIDSDAATSDQNSLVIHGQHSRPIDSDAATSDQKSLVVHGQRSRPIDSDAATSDHKSLVIHGQDSRPINSAAASDQKSLDIHGQRSRSIDSDAATSDDKGLSNTTEGKMELTKKRLQERYKEVEIRKQKRKIQVIDHYEVPKNSLPPKAQHVKPVNKRVKR